MSAFLLSTGFSLMSETAGEVCWEGNVFCPKALLQSFNKASPPIPNPVLTTNLRLSILVEFLFSGSFNMVLINKAELSLPFLIDTAIHRFLPSQAAYSIDNQVFRTGLISGVVDRPLQ